MFLRGTINISETSAILITFYTSSESSPKKFYFKIMRSMRLVRFTSTSHSQRIKIVQIYCFCLDVRITTIGAIAVTVRHFISHVFLLYPETTKRSSDVICVVKGQKMSFYSWRFIRNDYKNHFYCSTLVVAIVDFLRLCGEAASLPSTMLQWYSEITMRQLTC